MRASMSPIGTTLTSRCALHALHNSLFHALGRGVLLAFADNAGALLADPPARFSEGSSLPRRRIR